jgi:hypothetical protein
MTDKSTSASFKEQLRREGYADKTTEELWKWYDPSKKKGIASF